MDTKTLTDSLARRLDYNKKDVAVLLESLSSVVREHCGELDSIAVPGFGCFEPKKRMERVMVMPSTGKRMLLPQKISLSFKPSAILKQRLRKQTD